MKVVKQRQGGRINIMRGSSGAELFVSEERSHI